MASVGLIRDKVAVGIDFPHCRGTGADERNPPIRPTLELTMSGNA